MDQLHYVVMLPSEKYRYDSIRLLKFPRISISKMHDIVLAQASISDESPVSLPNLFVCMASHTRMSGFTHPRLLPAI